MSNLSDLSINEDLNSNCDNEMFVLPSKTALNSSLYLNGDEKSNSNNFKICDDFLKNRKIGINIQIPSYKGFSVPNKVQINNHQVPRTSSKSYIDGAKIDDYKRIRKVTAWNDRNKTKISTNTNKMFNNKVSLLKDVERSGTTKIEKNKIKYTDSCWSDLGQSLKTKKEFNSEPFKENRIQEKIYDKTKLEQYIKDKRHNNQRIQLEQSQLENERKERIKKNLINLQNFEQKRHIQNNEQKTILKMNLNERNVSKEALMTKAEIKSYSTTDSTDSLKKKLNDWKPMDKDKLITYKYKSMEALRKASSSSNSTNKVLKMIMNNNEKLRTATEDLINYKTITEKIESPEYIWRDLSESESDSEFYQNSSRILADNNRNDMIKRTKRRLIHKDRPVKKDKVEMRKHEHQNSIYNENMSKIIAQRELLNEGLIDMNLMLNKCGARPATSVKPSSSKSHVKVKNEREMKYFENYDNDRISKLIEEREQRYESSLDTHKVTLPFNKLEKKPIASVIPYATESDKISKIGPSQRDPLRFIEVYKKSKSSSRNNEKLYTHSPTPQNTHIIETSVELKSDLVHDVASSRKFSNSESQVCQSVENKQPLSAGVGTEHCYNSQVSEDSVKGDVSFSTESVSNIKEPNKVKKCTYNKTEARFSPNSLERLMNVALENLESIGEGRQQLSQIELLQGVALSQQETVSLAQILKSRQFQDARQEENIEITRRLATTLENIEKRSGKRKRSLSSILSDSTESSTTKQYFKNKEVKSSTDSDASEIQEEIVESASSSIVALKSKKTEKLKTVQVNEVKTVRKEISHKLSTEESEISENIENVAESFENEVDTTSNDQSIREIISSRSLNSPSTVTYDKNLSLKEVSTDKSAKVVSWHSKTSNGSRKSSKEISSASHFTANYTEKSTSSDASIPTETLPESSFREIKEKSDSLKEISTARNSVSEGSKLYNDSTNVLRNSSTTIESGRKSVQVDTEYSLNTFEESVNKSQKVNMSANDTSSGLEHSDIDARIAALKFEKSKKKNMVKNLTQQIAKNKNIRKAKTLTDHVKLLDTQIILLKKEIENSDLSLSSISSVHSISLSQSKTKQKKENNKENILPNHSSKSSSLSSISRQKEISMTSQVEVDNTESISSSSTLISEKDGSRSLEMQKNKNKNEEIDTPRSVKQLQFGDINEEYSASDRDSSELRTPSEKSKISREFTDNGATKSKSEKFHVLNLNEGKDEEGIENIVEGAKIGQDDGGMMSARTIHSEISDIPDECEDISDRNIEDFEDYGKNEKSQNDQESSYRDLYSDKFTDCSSHKSNSGSSKSAQDSKEVSVDEKQLENKTSSESSDKKTPFNEVVPSQKELSLSSLALNEDYSCDYDHVVAVTEEKIFQDLITESLESVKNEGKYDSLDQDSEKMSSDEESVYELEQEDQLPEDIFWYIIPWTDEEILPLIDVAVKQMFEARKTRTGLTGEVFNQCCENIPEVFTKKNDAEVINQRRSEKTYFDSLDEKERVCAPRFISKELVYYYVMDILREIFSLDDDVKSKEWMKDIFRLRTTKMIRLWNASSAPESIEVLRPIVIKEMQKKGILTSDINHDQTRSRLHTWCLNHHKDKVDQLLVDETMVDEAAWNTFDELQDVILNTLSDNIISQLVEEEVEDNVKLFIK